MPDFDFLICGSGIAGASLAAELASHGQVVVVEQEDSHGYHTSGRSAAIYIESYGNETIRRLTAASRAFFDAPPEGFAEHPLLSPRGCLTIATAAQGPALEDFARNLAVTGVRFQALDGEAARAMAPALYEDAVVRAIYEPDSSDIDVNALHMGYLRLGKARGVQHRLSARIEAITPKSGGFAVRLSGDETVTCRVVADAAGAWADPVAALAGLAPLGLTPLRRTAVLIEPPPGFDTARWPAVIDVDEQFYFKPEAGLILASPADETPSPPLDAAPDELDIAICIDRIQTAADLPVRRVNRAWAGLRTFAPDRSPVFGFDPDLPGFFWYAGQGGYGMQIAPAAARLGAALALGRGVPADLAEAGITEAAVSPARFRDA